jgi:TrmH family RNA methyltransferase
VAALIEAKRFALEDALRGAEPMVLALAGVQDPGNVGTLLRSAEAFGAAGVLLLEGTVSAWNPKAVRAAAGSIFRLPAVKTKFEEALPKLREQGVKLVAGSSHKGKPLTREALLGAVCIVIGNEGAGVPRAVMDEVDEVVLIPHSPKVESLNAAVAGAVMMYEARRVQG